MDESKESENFSHFATLPIELFLHICSFLDVSDIVDILSRVCKRFNEILEDENIWKVWVGKRWNAKYPVAQNDSECFDWKGACMDLEKHWKTWKQKEKFRYMRMNNVHISSSDAILFLDSPAVCISGSRDRSMVVWSPLKENGGNPLYVQKQVAHDGWIWRMMYIENTLYSCSWDNTIKTWSADKGSLQNISTYRCTSPILSMTYCDGLIFAGDFGKTIYAFDPRCKPEPQFLYSPHLRAVLTLAAFKNTIISGSEDRTVVAWDIRTKNVTQKAGLGKLCYPNCSHMYDGLLYVGDNRGTIHAISTSNGRLRKIKTFETGHQKAISYIKHGRGHLLTSSLDGTIQISIPTSPPLNVATILSNGGEVSGMDYWDGVLAAGSTDSIEFWVSQEYSGIYE